MNARGALLGARSCALYAQRRRMRTQMYEWVKYGGVSNVTLVPGLGIGPEMTRHLRTVFEFSGVPVSFEEMHIDTTSPKCMDDIVTSIKRNSVAIQASFGYTNDDPKHTVWNVELRRRLKLNINMLHARPFPGITATKMRKADLVVIRQHTEGEYTMMEHMVVPGVVVNLKIITAKNAELVARFAFNYAKERKRKRVTTVHNANVLKLSDGLFLKSAHKVAQDIEFVDIDHDDMLINECAINLLLQPQQFDVLLLPSPYGTIVTNILCGQLGGPGLVSGLSIGEECVVFEPSVIGVGEHLEGKNIANPAAMIHAGIEMLKFIGHDEHAARIRKALDDTFEKDRILTADLGGTHTTKDVVDTLLKNLAEYPRLWYL